CLSSSVNSVTYRLDAGGDAPLVAVDRVTRDKHRGPGGNDQRGGARVDAAIHLDLDVGGHRPQAAKLLRAVRNELLTAESRLDGHDVDEVDVRQDLTQVVNRGGGVDRHARSRSQLLDRLNRSVQRSRRLHLDLDKRRPRLGELFEEQLWPLDHQM